MGTRCGCTGVAHAVPANEKTMAAAAAAAQLPITTAPSSPPPDMEDTSSQPVVPTTVLPPRLQQAVSRAPARRELREDEQGIE